jgi:hypothetical protein
MGRRGGGSRARTKEMQPLKGHQHLLCLQKGGKVWVRRMWAMKEHRGEVAEKIPFRREQELTNIYGSK